MATQNFLATSVPIWTKTIFFFGFTRKISKKTRNLFAKTLEQAENQGKITTFS